MKCPKCGVEIKKFDLSPNCKSCGVHIMYYTQEEDLMRDAKKTELEGASARLLVAKIKTAFIGGKIQIARLVVLLLAVASLLAPHFNVQLSFPWWEQNISVGALGVYSLISDGILNILLPLYSLGVATELYIITIVCFGLLILAALCLVAVFCLWLLSFVNVKKTSLGILICSAFAMCFQLTGTVLSFFAVTLSGAYEFITAKAFFGGIISALVIGALAVLSLLLYLNPPKFTLKEADKARLEIKKRLNAGEITLDDLSLPIVKEDEAQEKETKKGKRGKKK